MGDVGAGLELEIEPVTGGIALVVVELDFHVDAFVAYGEFAAGLTGEGDRGDDISCEGALLGFPC